MRILILSGLSGSGKSVALHMLEDLGFYCIDNIPAALLKPFISYTVRSAEATLHVSGTAIHTQAIDENMYAAIDLLTDKLDRCLKKHKEKVSDHRAGETRRVVRA